MSLLSEFASIRNGSLGMITTAKCHITLKLDCCPASQHTHRAELKKTEHEGQDTDQMLKEDVKESEMPT